MKIAGATTNSHQGAAAVADCLLLVTTTFVLRTSCTAGSCGGTTSWDVSGCKSAEKSSSTDGSSSKEIMNGCSHFGHFAFFPAFSREILNDDAQFGQEACAFMCSFYFSRITNNNLSVCSRSYSLGVELRRLAFGPWWVLCG